MFEEKTGVRPSQAIAPNTANSLKLAPTLPEVTLDPRIVDLLALLTQVQSIGTRILQDQTKLNLTNLKERIFASFQVTADGKAERLGPERISLFSAVEQGKWVFIDNDKLTPSFVESMTCSFAIIYNTKTRETFCAHSDGSRFDSLEAALKEARARFTDRENVVFIVGGGQITGTEASARGMKEVLTCRLGIMSAAQDAGFKVLQAFSEVYGRVIQPCFDPESGKLHLSQTGGIKNKSLRECVLEVELD